MFARASNIALSFILVVLSSGFTITQHFCREQLVNVGLYSLGESCEHDAPVSCCTESKPEHCAYSIDESDCCKNQSKYVKFSEQFTVKQKESNQPLEFSFLPVNIFFTIKEIFTQKEFKPIQLHPPSLLKDIPILFQSFLL